MRLSASRIPRVTERPAPSRPVSHSACVASAATAHAARSRRLRGVSRLTFHTASASESCVVPAVLDAGAAASISASIADRDAVSGDAPRPNRPATAETAARESVRRRGPDARTFEKRC